MPCEDLTKLCTVCKTERFPISNRDLIVAICTDCEKKEVCPDLKTEVPKDASGN